MHDDFRADGDTWLVTVDEVHPDRAVRTIVFHCLTDPQRPYRVIEVPEPLLEGRAVDQLGREELGELFGRSQTMDFSHDAAANPQSHGYGDPPLG